MAGISTNELIKALRICASDVRKCSECPLYYRPFKQGKSTCHDYILRLAATRLENARKSCAEEIAMICADCILAEYVGMCGKCKIPTVLKLLKGDGKDV